MSYLDEAAAIEEQIIADRRHLHANPEIGFDCPESAAYIKGRLDEMGIENFDCGVIDDETNKSTRSPVSAAPKTSPESSASSARASPASCSAPTWTRCP